jgi:hypothetical protein
MSDSLPVSAPPQRAHITHENLSPPAPALLSSPPSRLGTEGCLYSIFRRGAGSGGRGMTLHRRCGARARRSKPQPSRRTGRAPPGPVMAEAGNRSQVRRPQPGPTAVDRHTFQFERRGGLPETGSPPGAMRSKPINTARGTPWVLADLRNTLRNAQARRRADFDTPRCREASRPAGPLGPLASRAPSVL